MEALFLHSYSTEIPLIRLLLLTPTFIIFCSTVIKIGTGRLDAGSLEHTKCQIVRPTWYVLSASLVSHYTVEKCALILTSRDHQHTRTTISPLQQCAGNYH